VSACNDGGRLPAKSAATAAITETTATYLHSGLPRAATIARGLRPGRDAARPRRRETAGAGLACGRHARRGGAV
jgi:hypothetical protein